MESYYLGQGIGRVVWRIQCSYPRYIALGHLFHHLHCLDFVDFFGHVILSGRILSASDMIFATPLFTSNPYGKLIISAGIANCWFDNRISSWCDKQC